MARNNKPQSPVGNQQIPNQPQQPQPPVGNQQIPNQPYPPVPPQGPYPQYPPVAQPPRPPKQPMDPKKKKAIITWSLVAGGVVVLGIAALILVPIIFRVDYSTAYHAVNELEEKIDAISSNYDCGYILDYYDSKYTDQKTFSSYITNCKNTMSGTEELVNKLAETDGVKRNQEISTQFEKVKSLIAQVVPNADDLSEKLKFYEVWHNYDLAFGSDGIKYTAPDSSFQKAANVLIESGIDSLKTYGEGWLESVLKVAHAYQAYDNASYFDSNKSSLRKEYEDRLTEFKDYKTKNLPNIETLAPLKFNDTTKMVDEFNKLDNLITETYEKNYSKNSGDCLEFLGEIICE